MATVTRNNIGLLHEKLTVKLSKEDYLPSFEKKLKEYSKSANIPGFRKGMVPVGMVKKMYGSSIFTDEVLKSVEKELYTWLNAEKPEIFGQPLPLQNDLRGMDMNNPSDFEFGFEIGLKPAYTLADIAKAKVTLHKVKTTDAMIDDEVNRMQIKGGNMTEPETIDNEENVLNIQFTEADKDGNVVEGGVNKENSVILKYLNAGTQKKFMGKKVGDTVTVQLNKAFDEDKLAMFLQDLGFEKDDKEAAKKFFNLTIVKIGLIEKRALTEEFFKEIYPAKEIKTEAELREAIKEEIDNYWTAQSRNQLQDQLYHYLLDETKMEFPEEFLKRWLQTSGEKEKTAEDVEKEFPGFSNQLKWTLISDKLIKDNGLEVGNDELREYMKMEIMRYFGTMNLGDDTSWMESYIDRMMKDEKQVDSSYRRLITDKLFNWIEGQVKPAEKEVTADELNAMQHHHHH
ncbi:MAG: trigger factor [Ferruginibacter sp.]|nr:trigger factor [Bacteroidota bacterium]MBX2917756.1 trigger factor [Ferruginibacter sp.]MCB0709469.1 trigger factor [Chitinophagaceae bacterium]MCC7379547.1 trigger factor [Chitinophagaceae bacterium]